MPKKKATNSPAKARDHSVADTLDKRLKPLSLGKRVPKEVERFTEAAEHPRIREEVVIAKGKGKKLIDIGNVEPEIKKRSNRDPLLRAIHGLAFGGRPTKKTDVKEDLYQFSGVVYEEAKKERILLEEKILKKQKQDIQDILIFFGQDPKGEKADLAERLADFLEKPSSSDRTYERSRSSSPAKKRSSSKSGKKTRRKKDPNAPKKALSAYMFFVKDQGKVLRKKYPKEGVTDIAKRLGTAWGKLSNSEKREYQAKSDKDKTRYEREMKAYNRK